MGALAALAKAGPINPPAGAVAPTGKTLDEIFNKIPAGGGGDGRIAIPGGTAPVTISQPGSYVLTGNLTLSTNVTALIISADGVTLDLNGYTIANTGNTGGGVFASGRSRLIVRNGTLAGHATGINFANVGNVLLEDLVVVQCRTRGIDVQGTVLGDPCDIRRCTVAETGVNSTTTEAFDSVGIRYVNCHGVIEDCSIETVLTNTVTRSRTGIAQSFGTRVAIVNNRISNVTTGIGMQFNAGVVLRDNIVMGATTAYVAGAWTNAGNNSP